MIYAVFFLVLLFSELAYFRLAIRYNIIDKPNHRSSHSKITIRGGGIIFYISILLSFLFFDFAYEWFFIGATLIAMISFIDDMKPISSIIRLLVHFFAIGMMLFECGIETYPWYYTVFTLIFATGIINIYNFMDGINGITGTYSLVVLGTFWYINNYTNSFIDNDLLYMVMISILIFNFFNFRLKAKCFAGDIGSVTIAFLICFLLIKLISETEDISYLIILSVYCVDAVLTIIHRIMRSENILKAHRIHTYQLMANELKMPHLVVSSIYALIQLIVIAGYFLLADYKNYYLILSVLILGVIDILFRKKYFHLHQN